MGEEKRHEMMETLFGAESEDSDDEDALDRNASPYSDDEVEGGGPIDVESEGERAGSELEREESEGERAESEAEREDSDADHSFDEGDQQQKRLMTSERRIRQPVSASGSEQSHGLGQASEQEEDEVEQFHERHIEEDEVEQVNEQSDEGYDSKVADGVADMRDVFGDSEDEQEQEDGHHDLMHEETSASEEEDLQGDTRPEDIVADEEQHEEGFESDDEQPTERRARERPLGPPLDIDVPLCEPPGSAEKMHIVRVSNIMEIEPKAFDPKTYIEEEEHFITDEAGHKRRIRLEDNVIRWRMVHDRNGGLNFESNARFVKWSDGSMQLLIGNEVLDISVQNASQDQAHLFINTGKGLFQSQGRLLQKMRFMPSSLSSKSHRLLTAIVDSRNRKMYKVKNVITNKDPEREKEEAEKLHQKRIRSKEDLQRKQEKISRKYPPSRERIEPQLSARYLERELEEEDDAEDYAPRERRFQKMIEEEQRSERRRANVKQQQPISLRDHLPKRPKERRPSPPRRKLESEESEREEPSEYETDGQEEEAAVNEEEEEEEEEGQEEEYYDDRGKEKEWDEREDETYKKRKGREDESENEMSPPRKPVQRRRVVVSDSDED